MYRLFEDTISLCYTEEVSLGVYRDPPIIAVPGGGGAGSESFKSGPDHTQINFEQ